MREAEAPADQPAVAEQPLDGLGMGVRPDVEVLGLAPEEQIADAAPDQVRLVAGRRQAVENLERVRIDPLARDRVLAAGADARSGGGVVGGIVYDVCRSRSIRLVYGFT
jgi:hypothetical protein